MKSRTVSTRASEPSKTARLKTQEPAHAGSSRRRVKLSRSESELLKLLPTTGARRTTEQLVDALYKGKDVPFNARVIVGGRLRVIQAKLEIMDEPHRLERSKRRGPKPIEYWLAAK